ncbi:MAG: hypothetical protein KF866_08325 [Phycisphaeraceae bacterium]|nr:hypothetical protein [Phycisphaeraceae bacterium]MCW5753882.1 hypothetical protein [Phycisphaeraceae bacterium]
MPEQPGLSVRRSVRFELVLPVRMCIAPEHRGHVRWNTGLGGPEGWIDADLIDFSAGGIGVMSLVFVPRKTLVRFKVLGIDGGPGEPLLDAVARVQRVTMTDRRPAYLLGTSFERTNEVVTRQIAELIGRLDPALARAARCDGEGPGHA